MSDFCLVVSSADGTKQMVTENNPIPVLCKEEQEIDIWIQPTITAGAYTAGDALGDRLDFIGAARVAGGSGTITKIVIIDRDGEDSPIDVVFFDRAFTATADNSPFNPSDEDLANCIGYVDIAATDYADFANNSVATKTSGLRMPFDYVLNGTDLFAQMVDRFGNTYSNIDDITIKITIQRR